MNKYTIAREALGHAVKAGSEAGFDRAEMLLTMIVAAVSDYKEAAGKKAARDALSYELSELAGAVDTQFIRSR